MYYNIINHHTTKPMAPRTLHNDFTRRECSVQAAYAFDRYEKYNNQTANAYNMHITRLYTIIHTTTVNNNFTIITTIIIIIEIIIYYHCGGLNYSSAHNRHPVHPLHLTARGVERAAGGVCARACVRA